MDTVVGELDHLDGFRPAHRVELPPTLPLSVDKLTIPETAQVMGNEVRLAADALADRRDAQRLVRFGESLEDP